jgi:single-stranded DNA-binding protein
MKITGNIGRDPETKTTKGGKPFISFTVAESYGKEDNRTTNWFGISFFGKPEDMAGMTKGMRVEVDGDLKVNVKDGKAYLDMLTSRVTAAPLPPKKEQAPDADGSAPAPAGAPANAGNPAGAPTGGVADQFNDMDDDIPF